MLFERALAGRVLGWVTCLPVDFSAPYHSGPLNHSGSNWVNQLCSITLYGNLGACSWESIGAGELMRSHSRCAPSKETKKFQGLSNSCDFHFGITYKIRLT